MNRGSRRSSVTCAPVRPIGAARARHRSRWAAAIDAPVAEVVDVVALVEEVVPAITARFPRVRHSLIADRTGKFQSAIPGGVLTLRRITENLLINACEGDGHKSATHVEVRVARDPSGGRLLIVVSDDGPGFAREQLERNVEIFASTKPQGSGLGLFTCERLIRASEGRLERANVPGGGAQLKVILPLVRTLSGGAIFQEALRMLRRHQLPEVCERDLLAALHATSREILTLLYEAGHEAGLERAPLLGRTAALFFLCATGNLADDLADGDCDYFESPRLASGAQYLLTPSRSPSWRVGAAGRGHRSRRAHARRRRVVPPGRGAHATWTAASYREVGEAIAGRSGTPT